LNFSLAVDMEDLEKNGLIATGFEDLYVYTTNDNGRMFQLSY